MLVQIEGVNTNAVSADRELRIHEVICERIDEQPHPLLTGRSLKIAQIRKQLIEMFGL
jgi:hypothetical protein